MATNKDLNNSKSNPDDEFYTRLSDINAELKHYKQHFKDKVVLCNCDDPRVSNFFHYFAENFEAFGLKRLIATCYKNQDIDLFTQNESEKAVYIIYEGDKNGNRVVERDELDVRPLKGDGDFRSEECVELLEQADIVCTNPPFSLLEEYINQLMTYKKKFIILGNPAAIHYTRVFPYICNNELWIGFKPYSQDMLFEVSPEHEANLRKKKKEGSGWRVIDGIFYGRAPAIWFTNLEISKKHEDFVSLLYKTYSPEDYPTYENFDGIDVKKVKEIPKDYFGIMGVPDSFMEHYNPEQFEILGADCIPEYAEKLGIKRIGEEWMAKYRAAGGTGHYTANMRALVTTIKGKPKKVYSRLLIRRK